MQGLKDIRAKREQKGRNSVVPAYKTQSIADPYEAKLMAILEKLNTKSSLQVLLSVEDKSALKRLEVNAKSDINSAFCANKGVELKDAAGNSMKVGGKIQNSSASAMYKQQRTAMSETRLGGL